MKMLMQNMPSTRHTTI